MIVETEETKKACADLFFGVFTNPPWNYYWVTEDSAWRYVDDLFKCPGALGFLFFEENVAIGFCVGAVHDYFMAKQYEIKEYAVLTAYQGKGFGGRMLEGVEKFLRESGVANVFLHTSASIPACDFYLRNGYEIIKDNVFVSKNI